MLTVPYLLQGEGVVQIPGGGDLKPGQDSPLGVEHPGGFRFLRAHIRHLAVDQWKSQGTCLQLALEVPGLRHGVAAAASGWVCILQGHLRHLGEDETSLRKPRWRHHMGMLSALQALCEGNPLVPVWFLSQSESNVVFCSFMLLAWQMCWTNFVVAGDLRRNEAHMTSL